MLGTQVLEVKNYLSLCRVELGKYAHENEAVLAQFSLLGNALLEAYVDGEGLIDADLRRIFECAVFAAQAHRGHTRKNASKTPYIIHPIAVAHLLVSEGKVRDPDIIMAALLHDAVEDTDISLDQIEKSFGQRVAGFVAEVTDDPALHWKEQRQQQIEHAPNLSGGAAQIKLADKLHNLSDVIRDPPLKWTDDRVQAYVGWAQQVVDHLPWVNSQLQSQLDTLFTNYWKPKKGRKIHE